MKPNFEDLLKYFEQRKITNPKLSSVENNLTIENDFFYQNTYMAFVFLLVYLLKPNHFSYTSMLLLTLVLMLFWFDIKEINHVTIDFVSKSIVLKPKLPFIREKKYLFVNVKEFFGEDDEDDTRTRFKKWRVYISAKEDYRVLIHFKYAKDANEFAKFLNKTCLSK